MTTWYENRDVLKAQVHRIKGRQHNELMPLLMQFSAATKYYNSVQLYSTQ